MSTFTDAAALEFGQSIVTRRELNEFLQKQGRSWCNEIPNFKVGHGKYQFSSVPKADVPELTDDEILANIRSRFSTLTLMTNATVSGLNRSMIVSGPAGLGKTYSVNEVIETLPESNYIHIKGYVTPISLYKTLWQYKYSDNVIVFDDCDSIFSDETALNLLKGACDSSDKRFLSWMSDKEIVTEDGDFVPSSFEFNGSVVFITNLDFDKAIDKGTRQAPHFEALISRSHYVDLGIKTKRDYMIRIKQVVADTDMLSHISPEMAANVVNFIDINKDNMRELSLRMVKKVADLTRISPNWEELARCTCMKGE